MRPRYLLIAIIVFGAYVLGARAGRERYAAIKHTATKYWNDPAVKKARAKAKKTRKRALKAAMKKASSAAKSHH